MPRYRVVSDSKEVLVTDDRQEAKEFVRQWNHGLEEPVFRMEIVDEQG